VGLWVEGLTFCGGLCGGICGHISSGLVIRVDDMLLSLDSLSFTLLRSILLC
jgi:hypothetical protein